MRACPARDRCTLSGVDRTTGAARWSRAEAGRINTTWESDARAGSYGADDWPTVLPGYAVEGVDSASGDWQDRTVRVVTPATGDGVVVSGSAGVRWVVVGRQRLLLWWGEGDRGGTLLDPAAPTGRGVDVKPGPDSMAPDLYGRTLVGLSDTARESYSVTTGGSWTDLGDPFPESTRTTVTDGEWWVAWDEPTGTVRASNLYTGAHWARRLEHVAPDGAYLRGAVADGTLVLSYAVSNPLGVSGNSRVLVLDAATGAERGRALVPLTFRQGVPLPGGHGWGVVDRVSEKPWAVRVA